MGEVYRARDTRLGREVAIKVLPAGVADDRERLARFEREARVLASLSHPNIAAIHGVEESGAVFALVMELVEGETLAERLSRGPMPVADALGAARQMAEALEAAHDKGIVHRDLKPANVKITPGGVVKVLDFGLARPSGSGESSGSEIASAMTTAAAVATHLGAVVGTPAYMSPEQARGQPVDKRTDIWAFGCVVYEMLTGRRAFAGSTASDVVAAVLEREPDWSMLPGHTPASVGRILQRCLDKDATRRLRDVGEARVAIDRLAAGARGRPAAAIRRVAAGGLVVALLAIGAWLGWPRLPSGPDGGPPLRSLAVLPFRPLAGNADDYLGIGIAADVITRVSQIRELTVRPTSAVQKYADAPGSALEAGRELGVDAVLEGTLQRDGGRMRVTVNLISVRGGPSIWSDTVDVDATSLFEIQDVLSREIAARLRVSLSPQESARLAKRFTASTPAYELYLQGMQQLDRRGLGVGDRLLEGAAALFERAVAIDPAYALAHAKLAYCYTWLGLFNDPDNPRWIQRARESIARSVALDPQLAEPHIVEHEIAWSKYGAFDIERALSHLRQAQALDPTAGLGESGILYAHLGMARQSNDALQRARQIDPTSAALQRLSVESQVLLAQHAEAIATAERFGHFGPSRLVLSFLARRDYAGARRTMDGVSGAEATDPFLSTARALVSLAAGQSAGAVDLGRLAAEAEGGRAFHHTAYNIACIHALEGRPGAAIEWLQRTVDAGMPNYPLFATDPLLDSLRREPSFQQFLDRLKSRWDRLVQTFG
jgi:TolB-like protein